MEKLAKRQGAGPATAQLVQADDADLLFLGRAVFASEEQTGAPSGGKKIRTFSSPGLPTLT